MNIAVRLNSDCERNGTLPATRSPGPTSDESASGNCALELGEADCGGAGDHRLESYSMPQQRGGRYLLDSWPVYRRVGPMYWQRLRRKAGCRETSNRNPAAMAKLSLQVDQS